MRIYHSPKEYLDEATSAETDANRLSELARMQWPFVKAAVAGNPNSPPALLNDLTPAGNDPSDETIAIALARRRNAPPDSLRRLGRRVGEVKDRAHRNMGLDLAFALLSNPATPDDTIARLLDPAKTTPHYRLNAVRETRRMDVLRTLSADISSKVKDRALRKIADIGLE